MRVPVAEALPSVAEALLPGCGGSARFLQKQSQLLVLGLSLEFDNNFLRRGPISTTSPVGNRVNFTTTPLGNRVHFYFKVFILSSL